MRILSSPSCPLAGQSIFGQNVVCGSMTHLPSASSTEECHAIRSLFQVQSPIHRLAYTYLERREVENTINRDLFVPSRIRLQLCGCLCYQPLWFRRLNDLVLRMQVPDRVIGSK